MAQRIKGQEVTLSFVTPDGSATGLEDVSSLEAELQLEVLREGYWLGESTLIRAAMVRVGQAPRDASAPESLE